MKPVGGSIPADTFTGNRALDIEEALIFEIGRPEVTGVDLGTPAYGPGMDQVIIAIAGDRRLEAQPELPTLKESGIDVVCSTWTGIFGPPNMPPAIVAKLNAAIEASLHKPDVREKFQKIGLRVLGGPPGKMTERVAADRVQWTDIITGLNIDFSK